MLVLGSVVKLSISHKCCNAVKLWTNSGPQTHLRHTNQTRVQILLPIVVVKLSIVVELDEMT